jgi:Tol biopolymer transport system component
VPADGSGPPVPLLKADARAYIPTTISPDGRALIGFRNPTTSNAGPTAPTATPANEIWEMPLGGGTSGEAKPTAFIRSQFTKDAPQFSPDGKWVAYQADDSGRSEVYVVPYPGPGGKSQVSTDGGASPQWSRDGRELFYRTGDRMMAVDVRLGAAFQAGTPRMLFERNANAYDPAPDGKRFLLITQDTPGQSSEIRVVLNWVEELKRRVPLGN